MTKSFFQQTKTARGNTKSSTPVDNFGRDLTKMASDDKLDPIVGREEIERVSQILSRRKKTILSFVGARCR